MKIFKRILLVSLCIPSVKAEFSMESKFEKEVISQAANARLIEFHNKKFKGLLDASKASTKGREDKERVTDSTRRKCGSVNTVADIEKAALNKFIDDVSAHGVEAMSKFCCDTAYFFAHGMAGPLRTTVSVVNEYSTGIENIIKTYKNSENKSHFKREASIEMGLLRLELVNFFQRKAETILEALGNPREVEPADKLKKFKTVVEAAFNPGVDIAIFFADYQTRGYTKCINEGVMHIESIDKERVMEEEILTKPLTPYETMEVDGVVKISATKPVYGVSAD